MSNLYFFLSWQYLKVCCVWLTFCGCGDRLGVRHGERDGSHCAVVWGGRQDRGKVAWDLSNHLTTAVRLQEGQKSQSEYRSLHISWKK